MQASGDDDTATHQRYKDEVSDWKFQQLNPRWNPLGADRCVKLRSRNAQNGPFAPLDFLSNN
jgi:hypothetical protein